LELPPVPRRPQPPVSSRRCAVSAEYPRSAQRGDEASQRVAQLIFNPLMEFGDDLRVRPVLAERLDNPDSLTYVVHLRRGVTFHDGHELTSKDVVYTFGAFLDPAFISPFKGAYRVMRSVRALDDYTVEFKLDQLIDRATTALDEEMRKRFYAEAQKVIADDAPYIPIWNRTNVAVAQPSLTGLHLNPTGDLSALKDVARN
jgi:ABC-type transport system substrate-binding protein